MRQQPYEPPGVTFFDARSGRKMRLVSAGPWSGWLCYWNHGSWVTLRRATEQDLAAVEQAKGGD